MIGLCLGGILLQVDRVGRPFLSYPSMLSCMGKFVGFEWDYFGAAFVSHPIKSDRRDFTASADSNIHCGPVYDYLRSVSYSSTRFVDGELPL